MSFSLFATPQQQQQPQPQQSPFQPQQTSLFLPQSQQQQQFQPQQQQQQQPQQRQQPQQQLFLFTNDRTPASYSTNWADLHPDSQKILLQIEYALISPLFLNVSAKTRETERERKVLCSVVTMSLLF